jgi:predicted amino acid dehydrogenase
MVHLFWLSDQAWVATEPHLPKGLPGKPRVDDRRVISGILHVLKAGCRIALGGATSKIHGLADPSQADRSPLP